MIFFVTFILVIVVVVFMIGVVAERDKVDPIIKCLSILFLSGLITIILTGVAPLVVKQELVEEKYKDYEVINHVQDVYTILKGTVCKVVSIEVIEK